MNHFKWSTIIFAKYSHIVCSSTALFDLISVIVLLETYSACSILLILSICHCRAVFLRLVSLGVLLYTLWEQITCEGDINKDNCIPCNYYYNEYKVNNLRYALIHNLSDTLTLKNLGSVRFLNVSKISLIKASLLKLGNTLFKEKKNLQTPNFWAVYPAE